MQSRACLRGKVYVSCCLQSSIAGTRPRQRYFHRTAERQDEFPNHYETLSLQPGASEKEIKKQFYTLSKSHHPDLHPNDPDASKRFVQISEAYATLSSRDRRAIYDRGFARAYQPASARPQEYPSGSFSSAATPAGGRPASGLSRRRTQFRGPPDSFYKSGGWGEQGAKRAEYASRPSHSWEGQAGTAEDSGAGGRSAEAGMPGTGPGGFAHGFVNDVAHFDSKGHYQTHSTIERTRHRARRRVQREAGVDTSEGNGTMFGFIMVSSVLGLAVLISRAMATKSERSMKGLVAHEGQA